MPSKNKKGSSSRFMTIGVVASMAIAPVVLTSFAVTAGIDSFAVRSTENLAATALRHETFIRLSQTTPPTMSVIGGKDTWVVFTEYEAENMSTLPATLQAASVRQMSPEGDMADFVAVGIQKDGAVTTLTNGGLEWSIKNSPLLVIPPQSKVKFQLVGKMANVVPSSAVGGLTRTVARSGHTPQLQMTSGSVAYEGVGAKAPIIPSHVANPMVLRKSLPTLKRLPLSSTTLVTGIDQDLYKFKVEADNAGSIAWKSVTFAMTRSPGINLSNFRLRRGATDMDTSTVDFKVNCRGIDSKGTAPADKDCNSVTAYFKPGQEETIAGSGNVYTIHALVTFGGTGKYLSFDTIAEGTLKPATGFLRDNGTLYPPLALDTAKQFDKSKFDLVQTPNFLWSDNSELPHSSTTGDKFGSRDWTDEDYVNTPFRVKTNGPQTLSY